MRTLPVMLCGFVSLGLGGGCMVGGTDYEPVGPKADAPRDTAPAPAPAQEIPDMDCGGTEFQLERVPPNVMLVIDRSGSMKNPISDNSNTSKWSELKGAVSQLITQYDAQMRLGVSLYSADGDCAPGDITPYAANNGATVMSKINGKNPSGNTPTAATLDKVRKDGMLNDPTRENVVILATDGLPNCGDVDVAGKITALKGSTPPVKTYVIGVGSETASNPMLLNAWADAGGTARMGATRYHQANSPADLKQALDAIVGGIASCTFKLSQTPPDAKQIYVFKDGQPVQSDAVNGFSYDEQANQLTLNGATCDAVRMNASTKIQLVYGCPSPPLF